MRGTLTFTPPGDVIPDHERTGMLRARTMDDDSVGDVHTIDFADLGAPGVAEPGLTSAGFATADLAGNAALQTALRNVAEQDHLTAADTVAIRASLDGVTLHLGDGTAVQVLAVADDGLFHRRSGPNGHDVNPRGIEGINGHGGATYVHGDQDVYGTPLRQLMDGSAPEIFRHITPDGRNDDATTVMLNMWIPLHAPVQPLALLDRRTLDNQRHQLRYGLPVDSFLVRDEDATVNDIWAYLHDPDQRWYLHTEMGPATAYVFDTLGVAHGAAVLEGEDALEHLFLALGRACDAIDAGDTTVLQRIGAETADRAGPSGATPAIHGAWERMSSLIDQAAEADPAAWAIDARAAMSFCIRRSVEIRLVASLVG